MSDVQHREVAAAEAEMRLDRWVRRHYPALNHVALQKLLRTGQFRVDGKRVEAGTRLATGQTVRVPPLPAAPPEGARPAKAPKVLDPRDAKLVRSLVVHEDADLIALNKPAGLAVQGGTGTTRHVDGMLDALVTGRGAERPRLVHRLDRDTSGLLVVARTGKSAKDLMHAFQQHRVRKLYWAVLLRGPERDEGVIDLPLAKRGPAGAEKMAAADEEGGADDARWAKTAFRVLLRSGKVGAWVALLPLTGRTHQLRAHCAAIEAPILGDGKYGGKAAHPDTAPKGLMLHARELEIPRGKGKPLRLTADPPKAFKEALGWLGMQVEELPFGRLRDWPEEF